MPEVRLIKRVSETSSNILGVVNFPENPSGIPARGYIFDIELKKLYGDEVVRKKDITRYIEDDLINNAANHFISRTKEIKDKNFVFLLGFIKGKDWSKEDPGNKKLTRDIVYMPFEKSNGVYRKTKPYMVKSYAEDELGSGHIDPTPPTIFGDMLILAGYEELLTRTKTFESYILNFPEFPEEFGIRYVD